MKYVRCLRWALYAVILTTAAVAYGQDTADMPLGSDPALILLAWALKNGGLPAVAAWIGYMLSKALANFKPTIRLELPEDLRVQVVNGGHCKHHDALQALVDKAADPQRDRTDETPHQG